MRAGTQSLLALFCLGFATSACAQEPTEERPAQATPAGFWAREPVSRFPMEAQEARVASGAVRLRCAVEANGALTRCEVLEETPGRLGFAEAALEGAAQARVADVAALDPAGSVTFTVGFAMTNPGTLIEIPGRDGRTGLVQVDCRFLNSGRLNDCRILQEPEGLGLGQAALDAIRDYPFVMPPHWRSGPRITFEIRFTGSEPEA